MKNKEIESILYKKLKLEEIYVTNDGKHYRIIAIGKIFKNINNIQKQKIIYQPLTKYILNNTIHAVSIKTYTPKEWKKIKNNYTL